MRWKISNKLEDYNSSIKLMETEVMNIAKNGYDDLTWILEYPPLYTSGLAAKKDDLLNKNKFPIYHSNRGGKYTYHGPGQRVVYPIINLNNKKKEVRKYVESLESVVIGILEDIGINGFREKSAHGIFVKKDDGYKYKISSIGCRFKNWVSYHGFSINNNPDLENYNGINPCGLSNKFVTSIFDLGKDIAVNELDIAIKRNILKNI